MKRTILTLVTGLLLITSCKKEQTLVNRSSSNEFIEFNYNGNFYNYLGNQVGEVNEPTTTWETRIQTEGNATHFELLLGDTIVGTYSLTGSDISILLGNDLYMPYGNTNPLQAIVTKYDSIGGYIEGTFSGDAAYIKGNQVGDTTLANFANGSFKVIRDFAHS
jgi:hypothetical protein